MQLWTNIFQLELGMSIITYLRETRNSSKIRPLDMIAQLWKMFCKTPMNTHATISAMLLRWFVYAEALFDLREKLKICILAWNFLLRTIKG